MRHRFIRSSFIDKIFRFNFRQEKKVDKRSYRPCIPTYVGNLALCCTHPVEEKMHNFDNHKSTYYVCGDDSKAPTITIQYPLCKHCMDKIWLHKTFTLIAKRKMNKKSKNNDQTETKLGENRVVKMNENDDDNSVYNDIEDIDIGNDTYEKENKSEEDKKYLDKKKKLRSKKPFSNNLICEADKSFLMMHGPGDFSSLNCINFTNSLPLREKKPKTRKSDISKNRCYMLSFIYSDYPIVCLRLIGKIEEIHAMTSTATCCLA